jgi:hypothetical protein
VGTDSLSVIDRLFCSKRPAGLDDHSFDFLAECQLLMEGIPQITWKWRHIPGHQNEKGPQKLDIWAERNVLMDMRATLVYQIIPVEDTPKIQGTAIFPVCVNKDPIVCNFQDRIRKATVGRDLLDYWKSKGKLGNAQPSDMAWDALEKARGTLAQSRQHWLVKHTSGACSVGKVMLARKKWTNSKCPRCEEPVETTEHVWKCQHIGANAIWEKAIEELKIWLASQRTNAAVNEAICARLLAWRSAAPLPPLTSHLLGLPQALAEQDGIGWTAAFEGRWSKKWIDIQNRHFKNNRIRRTGRRWLTALIKKLWQVAWDLWEQRNGINQENQEAWQRLANQTIIRDEYGQGTIGLEGYDRCLFNKPMANRLEAPLFNQEAWIRRVQAARVRSEHNSTNRAARALENLRLLLTQLRHAPRIPRPAAE